MFIDSSVIAVMMTDEGAARAFAIRLQASTARVTSPMAVAKAAVQISSVLGLPADDTLAAMKAFLQLMNIQVLAVPPRAAYVAYEAEARFGIGHHAAALGADQCMTYACARYYRQPLLFHVGGYADTDLEIA